MIKIYYTVFEKPLPDEMFCEYLNTLPDFIKKDVLRYNRWEDRQASLFGKLLLKKGLTDMKVSDSLDHLKFTVCGKPFVGDFIDFSISHTSGCSMCALTKTGKIGLDIEAIATLDISQFEKYFSKAEWNKIINAVAPIDQFFHFWTKKESVIKADGRGLNISLCDFEVVEDSVLLERKQWQIARLDIKEKKYKAHLAYDERQHLEMIPVDFSNHN